MNGQPAEEAPLRQMMAAMKHRGPDDDGLIVKDHVALGHVRLSILDLSELGHQPMFSNDGRYCMVFNGEIFNYLELKEELKDFYDFKTTTDSEVLLAAYLKWGKECQDRFNGMWAFAIYDLQEKSLFISRDRYGIKPLFFYQDKDRFIFASEINSLYAILKGQLSVNDNCVFEYLVYNRTDQTTQSFVNEIERFQHGYMANVQDGRVNLSQWYRLQDKVNSPWSGPEEFQETFRSAVDIRLRSDVPLGVCLSGGLDSSSVTSLMMDINGPDNIHAFSAVYGSGKQGDESSFIDLYKGKVGHLHYIYPTEQTFLDELESFLSCHFEPVHTMSIYSQFKVLMEARKEVTVALDGQGADEQLGGYHYFFGSYYRELLRKARIGMLLSEMSAYYGQHKSMLPYKFMAFYMAPGWLKNKVGKSRLGWINPDFFDRASIDSKLDELLYNPKSLQESHLQHFEYKLEHNLKWNDLNSMFFSMEVRVPFLDYRIVEKNLSSPSDMIMKKSYTKWILREGMKGILPEQIRLRQDKVGFDNPADEWMKTPKMVGLANEALSSSELKNSGYLDLKACQQQLTLHQGGKVNAAKDIWKWINLYYFLRKF